MVKFNNKNKEFNKNIKTIKKKEYIINFQKRMIMISQFFKKSSLLALALLFVASISADHKKTKKIQVLVDPSSNSFFFFGNNGGGTIGTNVFAPRTAGGYYYLNGQIYPEGTINRNSTCYTTTKASIGEFICDANLLSDLTFDPNFPAQGTIVEDVRWDFYFSKDCDGQANNLVAFGKVLSGVFQPNSIGFSGAGMPVIGTKCNDDENFIKSAKAYFNNFVSCEAGPQILIEIEFDEEIVYHK